MANKNLSIFILIATLVAQASSVRATEHIVGDDKGWALGVDYVAWANSREFKQGDTLVFNYDVVGDFPVFHVTRERYECCCPMGSIQELPNTGHNVFLLTEAKEYAFIPKGVDCRQGMKLLITVKPSSGCPCPPSCPGGCPGGCPCPPSCPGGCPGGCPCPPSCPGGCPCPPSCPGGCPCPPSCPGGCPCPPSCPGSPAKPSCPPCPAKPSCPA